MTRADGPLVSELEALIGRPVLIVGCPWSCDDGWRGCDACNRCGTTGSGFRFASAFYPNTEDGFRRAIETAKAPAPIPQQQNTTQEKT
jgi:hypothetical protein